MQINPLIETLSLALTHGVVDRDAACRCFLAVECVQAFVN
jgi:hypothetical protein